MATHTHMHTMHPESAVIDCWLRKTLSFLPSFLHLPSFSLCGSTLEWHLVSCFPLRLCKYVHWTGAIWACSPGALNWAVGGLIPIILFCMWPCWPAPVFFFFFNVIYSRRMRWWICPPDREVYPFSQLRKYAWMRGSSGARFRFNAGKSNIVFGFGTVQIMTEYL